MIGRFNMCSHRVWVVMVSMAIALPTVIPTTVQGAYIPVGLSGIVNARMQDFDGSAPFYPEGNQIFAGVPIEIVSGGDNVWYAGSHPGANPKVVDLAVNETGVTNVYTIINTAWGQYGPNSYVAIEFYGTGGAFYHKDLIGNSDIRDYRNTIWTNQINHTTTQNVFSIGIASENVRLDMQTIGLPEQFESETLTMIRFIDTGDRNFQRSFVAGVTLETAEQINPVPEPSSVLLAVLGVTGLAGYARWKCRQRRLL